MKNTFKSLLTLFLCLISNLLLFAENSPGADDESGALEGQDPPASIDDWIGLLLVLGLILGYYILKKRKQISA